MSDDNNRIRDALFKWGVSAKPLAGRDAEGGANVDNAQPRPPRGGSAVPAKKRKTKKMVKRLK